MTTIDPRKVNLAEKDIEDWLYENPKALGISKWLGRQVRVPSGIIDLLGVEYHNLGGVKTPIAVVVEVKNVDLSAAAILQVCRYQRNIREIIDEAKNRVEDFSETYVKKVLVFKGGVTNELLYEAYAVDVFLHSFEIDLKLHISGGWQFTSEKWAEDKALVQEISQREPFIEFGITPPLEEQE